MLPGWKVRCHHRIENCRRGRAPGRLSLGSFCAHLHCIFVPCHCTPTALLQVGGESSMMFYERWLRFQRAEALESWRCSISPHEQQPSRSFTATRSSTCSSTLPPSLPPPSLAALAATGVGCARLRGLGHRPQELQGLLITP